MIYNNSLRPSTLFGIVLLLLAVAGTLMWFSVLVDEEIDAFDLPGMILLGSDLGVWVLWAMFWAHVRWIRIMISIILHGLLIGLAVLTFAILGEDKTMDGRLLLAALVCLGAGACVIGILCLHHRAMKCDLSADGDSPETVARRRSRNRRLLVTILAVVFPALVYCAWRVVPLLLAKPTISVDYVSEYNRVTKPADYDPNLNAAPHYERFFASFSPLPEMLLAEKRWAAWPGDLTPEEHQALEQWVAENEKTLQDLKQAVRCPYWWTEFQSEDGSLEGIQRPPHLEDQRRCTFALTTLAQYYAHRGDTERAFEILADLHTMGWHGTRRATLLDQLAGLAICQRTYQTVASILARTEVDGMVLEQLRRAFMAQIPQIQVPRFTEAESLLALDCIQRSFTDDGSGDGRLIPAKLYEMKKDGGLFSAPLPYMAALWICLNHPSRQKTVEVGQRVDEVAGTLPGKSPWQVLSDDTSYEAELMRAVEGNYFYRDLAPSLAQVITIGWRGKTEGQALVTVLRLLLHRIDKGRLPESLDELAGAGLLEWVPKDPYSDGPLVYKVTDDDFTLYSVGEDCLDNGGVPGRWEEFAVDRVFWPVTEGE